MRILTTAILSAGLMLGTAGLAHAQFGALKDAAKKAATDAAKDKAADVIGGNAEPSPLDDSVQSPLGDAASGVLGDSAAGSITSRELSGDETITAGKVILGGGSATDAAMAVGKSRVKSRGKDLLNEQVGKFGSGTQYEAAPETQGSGTTYETVPSAAPAPVQQAPVINCPSGTKAQADGTCMVSGDWGG